MSKRGCSQNYIRTNCTGTVPPETVCIPTDPDRDSPLGEHVNCAHPLVHQIDLGRANLAEDPSIYVRPHVKDCSGLKTVHTHRLIISRRLGFEEEAVRERLSATEGGQVDVLREARSQPAFSFNHSAIILEESREQTADRKAFLAEYVHVSDCEAEDAEQNKGEKGCKACAEKDKEIERLQEALAKANAAAGSTTMGDK
ncbi:hypothetical protein BKA80DRAFT_258284 [Phyllosticta citrichinensis]